MKKKFTVAILGAGARGLVYASLLQELPEKFEITAVCDFNHNQLEKMNRFLNLPSKAIFDDEDEFLKEKLADVLIIATWDKYHVDQCLKAMRLGYDILLEKPVSDSTKEIKELLDVQKETQRKIVVCHVLRYGAGYIKISDILSSGVIGNLVAIDAMERVAYWHQVQAYIRLQSTQDDYPTILAKCCHDLDYIQYFAKSRCDAVSSIGSFNYFIPENAPEGATDRCLDCPHINSCIYSAKKIYIDNWKKQGCPEFTWPFNKVTLENPTTEEALYEGLKTVNLGICVFRSGVESNPHVVDHQMVQMHFKNGVDATLKMQYAAEPGRRINLFGTAGEIVFDELYDMIEIKRFGHKTEKLSISDLVERSDSLGFGHGGGDYGLIKNLYSILSGEKVNYTSLEESMESHLIGIKAEESRLSGGKTVKVH